MRTWTALIVSAIVSCSALAQNSASKPLQDAQTAYGMCAMGNLPNPIKASDVPRELALKAVDKCTRERSALATRYQADNPTRSDVADYLVANRLAIVAELERGLKAEQVRLKTLGY